MRPTITYNMLNIKSYTKYTFLKKTIGVLKSLWYYTDKHDKQRFGNIVANKLSNTVCSCLHVSTLYAINIRVKKFKAQ